MRSPFKSRLAAEYVSGQKKYYLPIIFREDRVESLTAYAAAKKITKSNVDKDYLDPAIESRATQCIAWLLEWKQTNILSKAK